MRMKSLCLLMSVMMIIVTFPLETIAATKVSSSSELSTKHVQELLIESSISKTVIASESASIENEVEILNAFGYNTKSIKSADLENGEIIYNIEATAVDSYDYTVAAEISIEEDKNGDVSMNIAESNDESRLLFRSDRRIFLDGKEVFVTESTEAKVEGSAIYRMTNVPYGCGSASKYSYYGGIRNWNIELNDFICKTAVVVCASIIAWGVGGGLGVAALLPITNQIVNYATSTDGKALSVRSKMYYNTDFDRFMISSCQGCRKEYTDFYSTGNYTHKMNSTPLVTYYYVTMNAC